MFIRTVLLLTCCLWVAPALAGDTLLTYDRVNLSAMASGEVENDTLVAVLYAQQEGKVAARAADEVNRAVSWAVAKAKGEAGIKAQTLDYRTNPVYRQQLLTGWQVRQSLRLESRDSAGLSQLVGDLQERLAVANISYAVSPERRQEAEAGLISEAIARFKERARQIASELERPGYRLVQMEVNTAGEGVVPPQMRAMTMEMAAAPPTLEAGSQRLQATVTGTIELQER
jgi:predicted secreted protein